MKQFLKFVSVLLVVMTITGACQAGLSAFAATVKSDAAAASYDAETAVSGASTLVNGTCGDNLNWELDLTTGVLTISGTGEMYNDLVLRRSDSGYVKTIIIQNGVTSIGDWAFAEFTNLASIEIPDSVTSIGYEAFFSCTSLASIEIPDSVTSIGDQAFYECTNLASIEIPDSVTSIGEHAFYWCTSLASVKLSNSLTSIGDSAFCCCKSLESIEIPNSVTSIGDWAFYSCESLESVKLSNSVASIGYEAFENCTSLASIEIPDSVTSIGESAFYNCTSLASVKLSNSLTSIGDRAFEDCTSLASIEIPDSVTSIGEQAFYWCTNLASIEIPNSVTSIGKDAFYNCGQLVIFGYIHSYAYTYAMENNIPFITLSTKYSGKIEVNVDYDGSDRLLVKISNEYNESLLRAVKDGNAVFSGIDQETTYTVELLTKSGRLIDKKSNVKLASDTASVSFNNVNLYDYTASVVDENGNKVNDYTITWFVNSSSDPESKSDTVTDLKAGDNVKCAVTIGDELKKIYEVPEAVTTTVQASDKKIVIKLKKAETKNTKIIVKDINGNPLPKADVSIIQKVNQKLNTAVTYTADENGEITVSLRTLETGIKVFKESYFSASWSGVPDGKDITIVLESAVGASFVPVIKSNYINGITHSNVTTDSLTFSIKNLTNGKYIENFSYENGTIKIPNEYISKNDKLLFTAVDSNGVFCDTSATVTYTGSSVQFDLTLTEKGIIKFSFNSSNEKNMALIFNANGDYVSAVDLNNSSLSSNLDAGNYKAVIMGYCKSLYRVSSYSDLLSFGLKKNSDFIEKDVSVADAEITEISNVTIPKFSEENLFFIDTDKSYISISPSNSVPGNYLIVSVKYSVLDRYRKTAAPDCVTITLPEGIKMVSDSSLRVDNVHNSDYTYENNVITVPVANNETVIMFSVSTEAYSGQYDISANITFLKNNKQIVQPIGTALLKFDENFIVPDLVGDADFPVSGKVSPLSDVEVYADNILVGSTKSNNLGSFSYNVHLENTYNHTYHSIYFVIKNGSGVFYKSKTYAVEYDINSVSVLSLSMSPNGMYGGSVKLYSSDGNYSSQYYYYPGVYDDLTYTVEFSGNVDVLKNVRIISTASNGQEIIIPLDRVGSTKTFAGTYHYSSSTIPVSLSVDYDYFGEVFFDSDNARANEEKNKSAVSDCENAAQELEDYLKTTSKEELNEIADCVNQVINNSEYKSLMEEVNKNYTLLEQTDNSVSIKDNKNNVIYCSKDWTDTSKTANDLLAEGYTKVDTYNENDRIYSLVTDSGSIIADLSDGSFSSQEVIPVEQTINLPNLINNFNKSNVLGSAGNKIDSRASLNQNVVDFLKNTYNVIGKYADLLLSLTEELHDFGPVGKAACKLFGGILNAFSLNSLYDQLSYYIDACSKLDNLKYSYESLLELSNKCNFSAQDMITLSDLGNTINDMQNNINVYLSALEATAVSTLVGLTSFVYSLVDIEIFSKVASITLSVLSFLTSVGLDMAFENLTNYIDNDYNLGYQILSYFKRELAKSGCVTDIYDNLIDQSKLKLPNINVNGIMDPSGYVCEAVSSNRLEGVTATIYYSPNADGSDAVIWNAEDYNQKNPLLTNSMGQYEWYVPEGYWQVKYEKDGYQTQYSDWLPVPPPQMDINVAMVSLEAPTVKNVMAYPDSIDITFSQYMNRHSVTSQNIKVTQNGKTISGTITPLDKEASFNDADTFYASKFRFVPSDGTALSGTINVSIADAVNYAGSQMDDTFTNNYTVQHRVTSIEADNTVTVNYGQPVTLNIKLLPGEAAANKTVNISTDNSTLISVDKTSVVTDENGMAQVTVSALLPGAANITYQVDGTDVTATTKITCTNIVESEEKEQLEKVQASVASGSVVEAGTQITLTCSNPDAQIYYTLDSSCPCQLDNPARTLYTGPITVNEDTVIVAYAVLDGYEDSNTNLFIYTVKKPILLDVNCDGVVSILDATEIQKYLVSMVEFNVIQKSVADANGDGVVSILDATEIQKYLVGLSSILSN